MWIAPGPALVHAEMAIAARKVAVSRVVGEGVISFFFTARPAGARPAKFGLGETRYMILIGAWFGRAKKREGPRWGPSCFHDLGS